MRSLTAKIVQGASYVQVKHKVGVVSFELQVLPAELNGGIMGYKHRSESYQAWVLQTSIWPGYSNSGPDFKYRRWFFNIYLKSPMLPVPPPFRRVRRGIL